MGAGGGGGEQGIWSPAGGWYADPKRWRRNTAICFAISAVILYPIFLKSKEIEVHNTYPSRPIPSQRWNKNFPAPPSE
jgi:hypothetical protein